MLRASPTISQETGHICLRLNLESVTASDTLISRADEPLLNVELGCLEDRLTRPEDRRHDDQEEGRHGRQDERPVGERAQGERPGP
jgi:hypothetical protein